MALPMGRLDIGDYLGLTFETISRVLSKFLNEEIIGFAESSRDIVLLNRERLGSLYAARGTRKTRFNPASADMLIETVRFPTMVRNSLIIADLNPMAPFSLE
jgi:Bacterial regulatory proteins, crp family